ncbi:hypothetical protein ABW365_08160 [Enterococcus avium]
MIQTKILSVPKYNSFFERQAIERLIHLNHYFPTKSHYPSDDFESRKNISYQVIIRMGNGTFVLVVNTHSLKNWGIISTAIIPAT